MERVTIELSGASAGNAHQTSRHAGNHGQLLICLIQQRNRVSTVCLFRCQQQTDAVSVSRQMAKGIIRAIQIIYRHKECRLHCICGQRIRNRACHVIQLAVYGKIDGVRNILRHRVCEL